MNQENSEDANDIYQIESIKEALKQWRSQERLGEHPLAKLDFVRSRNWAKNNSESKRELGQTLQEVLLEAINQLPDELSVLLKSYYEDDKTKLSIGHEHHISIKTFDRRRDVGFTEIGSYLSQQEAKHKQEWLIKRQSPPYKTPKIPKHKIIGRESQLDQLKNDIFINHVSLVAIIGNPGVGKTTLVLKLIIDEEIRQYFWDEIFWAGLGKSPDGMHHLSEWANALGIHPEELLKLKSDQWADRIKKAIGLKRILIVLDDIWEEDIAQHLISAGGSNCCFILTTRSLKIAREFPQANYLSLSELDHVKGFDLLSDLAPTAVSADPKAAEDLIKLVGGLPLAITLIGHFLEKISLTNQVRRIKDAINELQDVQKRLELSEYPLDPDYFPPLGKGEKISLKTVIAWSDTALDEITRSALHGLTIFPPKPHTFSEEAATEILDVPARALDDLVDSGLLESYGSGRYSLHQTIYDYAKKEPSTHTVLKLYVEYFLNFVRLNKKDYPTINSELQNILTALNIAKSIELNHQYVEIVLALYEYLEGTGMYEKAKELVDTAYYYADESKDSNTLAGVLICQGRNQKVLGNYNNAEDLFRKSLILADENNDEPLKCAALEGLGVSLASQGNFNQVEGYWLQALEITKRLHLDEKTCDILQNLGALLIHMSRYEEARGYLWQCLTITREINYLLRESTALSNLASLESKFQHYDLTEEYLQKSLAITEEIGYSGNLIFILSQLSATEILKGDIPLALEYIQKAQPLTEQIGTPYQKSHLLKNYGEATSILGDYQGSNQHFSEALSLARSINNIPLIKMVLAEWGESHHRYRNFSDLEVHFDELLLLAIETNDIKYQGIACAGLSLVEKNRGNHLKANEFKERALALFSELEDFQAEEIQRWVRYLTSS